MRLMLRARRKRHPAAAPPSSVMNSRRLIPDLPLQTRSTARSACHRAANESYRATWIVLNEDG